MGMEFTKMNLTFEQLLIEHRDSGGIREKPSPEVLLAKSRSQHLKKTYGITLEDYNELFLRQNEKCAICGKAQTESNRRFGVDHDHRTGKIRGILCSGCNSALGYFERYKEKMQEYLNGKK